MEGDLGVDQQVVSSQELPHIRLGDRKDVRNHENAHMVAINMVLLTCNLLKRISHYEQHIPTCLLSIRKQRINF